LNAGNNLRYTVKNLMDRVEREGGVRVNRDEPFYQEGGGGGGGGRGGGFGREEHVGVVGRQFSRRLQMFSEYARENEKWRSRNHTGQVGVGYRNTAFNA
jgi:hypothetical protein